jgi:hypothetical protein
MTQGKDASETRENERTDSGISRVRLDGQLFFDSGLGRGDAWSTGLPEEDRTIIFVSDVLSVNLMMHPDPGGFRHYYGQILDPMLRSPVSGATLTIGEEPRNVAVTNEYGEFALSLAHTDAEQILTVETEAAVLTCRIPETPGA